MRQQSAGVAAELVEAPWRELDGPSLVMAAAGLQLLPQNIPHLLRLERLAAIGVALPARPTAPRLSPSRLRALLKHELVSGPAVRQHQDRYDDLYTYEVPFYTGPAVMMGGLAERSCQTLALLLRGIFLDSGSGLPQAYRDEALPLVATMLRLSDEVCRRAGLSRGVAPPQQLLDEVTVPGQAGLDRLCQAVSFGSAELARLAPRGGLSWLGALSVAPGTLVPLTRQESPDVLVSRPLLGLQDSLVVSLPGELPSALRHHLVLLAHRHNCVQQLAGVFHKEVFRHARQSLTWAGAEPLDEAVPPQGPLVTKQRFMIAGSKVVDLVVIGDTLADYDPVDPFKAAQLTLSAKALDPSGSGGDLPDLQIVVHQSIGRTWTVLWPTAAHIDPRLSADAFDLRTMVELDGQDPLFLWRFARARTALYQRARVVAFSVLDEYAHYRGSESSFYLSDDAPASLVLFEVAEGLALRVEAQQLRDIHSLHDPRDDRFVEVISRHGTLTAPLYYSIPGKHPSADVVEWEGLHLWVSRPEGLPDLVSGLADQVQEAAAYWLWQACLALPELVRAAAGENDIVMVSLAFDDEEAWDAIMSGTQDMPAAGALPWVHGGLDHDGGLLLRLSAAGAGRLLAEADNAADRGLAQAAVTALQVAAGQDPSAMPELLELMAPRGNKRKLHAFQPHEITFRSDGLPSERLVQPTATADILQEMGAWLRGEGMAFGPVDPAQRTEVLKKVVGHYFKRIVAAVARLSPDGLLEQLLLRDEALLYRQSFRDRVLPSFLACFGGSSLPALKLAQQSRKHVEASIASRFLIEYVAATPPAGTESLTLDAYDDLLALAAELVSRASLSDAIHYGFSQTQISLLESGRLGISLGDRYQAGLHALSDSQAETLHRMSLEPQPASPAPEAPDGDVETAMQAEFGFSFEHMRQGIGELLLLGDKQAHLLTLAPEADVVSQLCGGILAWPQDRARAFIDRLSLQPRPDFMSIGIDACPWRFNRDRSYARRPIIKVPTEQGTALLWAPRRVYSAARYWTDLIYSGRVRATSKPMKRLMGTIRQAENKQFEQTAADMLRRAGCPIVATSVSKVNGRRLASPTGDDLGDIDALGIDPASRKVILVEAKDFELARTPAELAGEADSLLQGDKSAVSKHTRRTHWIRENLASVLKQFGVADHRGPWTVLPVIATSRDLISPRVLPTDIPIVPIYGLETWMVHQLAMPARKHRRGK